MCYISFDSEFIVYFEWFTIYPYVLPRYVLMVGNVVPR